MSLKDTLGDYSAYIQNIRREFHQYPELSMQEVKTTKRIAEKLKELKIPHEITPSGIGVIGIINGNRPGQSVALRADIDALPVTEKTGLPFCSKNQGIMHACGHDTHIAMLLGAAKMLADNRDQVQGRVYLIFQPAEEIGKGATYMMSVGDWYEKISAIFGAHIWTDIPAGKFSVKAGPAMAATDRFVIKVHGKQSHGSQPHAGIDAVLTAAAIAVNLQSIISRQINALDTAVLTIGTIHGGDRWNIVGGEASLEGTTRYFDPSIGALLEERMNRIINSTAEAYGATAEIEYLHVVPPTVNDPTCSEMVAHTISDLLGNEALLNYEKVMGSEDFAFYQKEKAGGFFFIGARNPDIGAVYSNHSDHFTIDESVLPYGALIYAQLAINWLNG